MLRRIGIIAVLALMVTALAAVPALAAKPGSGGLRGTPITLGLPRRLI